MGVVVGFAKHGPFLDRLRRVTGREVIGMWPGVSDRALKDMIETLGGVDLVFIADEVEVSRAFDVGNMVRHAYPDVPIVLSTDMPEAYASAAKRAGITETIDGEMSDMDIERLVTRYTGSGADIDVIESSAPLPEQNRVIVVLSPKGGVGKTTLASNLAVAMSRKAPQNTVIVDYDAQYGDVSSALNVTAPHTLEEAFTADAVQNSLVVKGLLATFDKRLFVLAGSHNPAAMEKVSGRQARQLIEQLSADYPFVVVDTGSGLTDEALAALEVATDVVFVSTMDVSAIRSLRRTMDLLERLRLMPPNQHLLVNLAEEGTGLTEDDIAGALRSDIDGVIPRSTEVTYSVNTGKPYVQIHKSGPFVEAIDTLVQKITTGVTVPAQESATTDSSLTKRLFKRGN